MSNVKAQYADRYVAGISGGWLTTIAARGPKYTTEVGDVRFLHPMSAIGYAYFDMQVKKGLFLGIEMGLDQFDFGYAGTPFYAYSGLSSGLLASNENIYLYKAGGRLSYSKSLTRKILISGTFDPAVGYYAYSSYLTDTAKINAYIHNVRPPGSNKIQYINYPPYQKEGLHFTLKGTVMFVYRIGKKIGLTADVAWQQGFSNFLTDSVSIRQYQPVTLKRFEHVYYTKVTGTSFQFHVGLQYRFGGEIRHIKR